MVMPNDETDSDLEEFTQEAAERVGSVEAPRLAHRGPGTFVETVEGLTGEWVRVHLDSRSFEGKLEEFRHGEVVLAKELRGEVHIRLAAVVAIEAGYQEP